MDEDKVLSALDKLLGNVQVLHESGETDMGKVIKIVESSIIDIFNNARIVKE